MRKTLYIVKIKSALWLLLYYTYTAEAMTFPLDIMDVNKSSHVHASNDEWISSFE